MLVPPLRVPLPSDVKTALADWLDLAHQGFGFDNGSNIPEFTSMECMSDLATLDSLRAQLSDAITTAHSYEQAVEVVPVMHEYFAMLKECEDRGFPRDNGGSSIKLSWRGAFVEHEVDVHSGLALERASILWNLAAMEAYVASTQDCTSNKKAWMAANQSLQNSFSFVYHLKELLKEVKGRGTTDMQSNMVTFWENALQAQAQMAGYEKASATSRPKHLLLAKFAQASSPLWDAAADACTTMIIPEASRWEVCSKAWSLYVQSRAEYHESATHEEKKQTELEVARLEKSISLGDMCYDYLATGQVEKSLSDQLPAFLDKLHQRYNEARRQAGGANIPNNLNAIRGALLSKGVSDLPKTMRELSTPMFTNLLGPAARKVIDSFHSDMDKFVLSMSAMAEDKTEDARKALASVNLPHSLTAYKQEQSGGGIPLDLWERVEKIQHGRKISILKQELWGLRDVAEQARAIFTKTEKQLIEDVEMDNLFRQQNPSFEGHDVQEIQRSFCQSLTNYGKLLTKSQEGDAVLLRRLEALDQDPKYKLLQFSKSQLDRLLPGSGTRTSNFDTTYLSRLLVELSNLFHDREVTLGVLKDEVRNYDIRAKVQTVNPDSPTADKDYQLVVKKAQKSFSGIAYEIQLNIDKQLDLLETIMQENAQFMSARDSGSSSAASESCIAMIEDAIEEIDQLAKHLKEGKDFYEVVIPKLEQLKHQVGDASVRLTVERCEFEDGHMNSAGRRQQEQEDARMAASLAGDGRGGQGESPHADRLDDASHPLSQQPGAEYQGSRDHMVAASHPGVVNVNYNEPQVRVDDEKVASLVAMDFDPDKVVAALRKYDNNVEQALNELLSC